MKAEYVDSMGDDLTVVNAARVSFDKESDFEIVDKGLHPHRPPTLGLGDKDRKLINYLAKHNHWSPFAHPQITLRYTVPIFVARQEMKHQIGFTRNEVSRRYVDDEPEFFYPMWRERPDGGIKQGSGKTLGEGYQQLVTRAYDKLIDHAESLYEELIENGIAPEQARMILPQSMYTSYYVTGSLAAFARFYRQRSDTHAQFEIRELAEIVKSIVEPLYPVSWKALTEVE